MKVSKTTLIAGLTLMLAALAPLARAQDTKDAAKPDRPPAGQRERRGGGGANSFDRIAERLKLNDEQKTKLQPIFQEEATKLRELRQDTSLTQDQRREKVRGIRDQFLAKAKPILSTEQLDELKKLREQAPNRPPRGGGQGGARSSDSSTEKKAE